MNLLGANLLGARFARPQARAHVESQKRWRPLLLFVLAAVVGAGLAAVQILPTQQWSKHSRRAASDHPRNVYELALGERQGDFSRGTLDNLLVHPGQADGHLVSSYQFSIGPWQWVELIWPNITGEVCSFPSNTALPCRRYTICGEEGPELKSPMKINGCFSCPLASICSTMTLGLLSRATVDT